MKLPLESASSYSKDAPPKDKDELAQQLASISTKDIHSEGNVLAVAVGKSSSLTMGNIQGQNIALIATSREIPTQGSSSPLVFLSAENHSSIHVNNITVINEPTVHCKNLGVMIRAILLKIVESQLESKERKAMACYLEPEFDGELLKTTVLSEFRSGDVFKTEGTSVLVTGDVGMGKTMFLLRLAHELLTSESDFLPIYISLVGAFERGFLSKKNYCDVIAEMCCANKDRTDDLSLQDVVSYLNQANIIHLIDGCDEIPVEYLRDIYSQCLKGDLGSEQGFTRHMLFTCRSEVLLRHPAEFPQWFSAIKISEVHFRQFELKSISHTQCMIYLEKFVDREYVDQTIA
ncbi:MAG: hypothetical protein M3R00_03850, partial [Pseudomonadota bacterium]|nr:hypothetical protein [Pseudomonadota bacterium]